MYPVPHDNPICDLLGKVVGRVQILQPQEHIQHYEVACWWEKSMSHTGVFPLVLQADPYNPKSLRAVAMLPGTVVDDYFPALFGGVVMGNTQTGKGKGNRSEFHIMKPVEEAINLTGIIPSDDINWAVDPTYWPRIIEYARHYLASDMKYLQECWTEYREEGDGEYQGNVSALHYSGENVAHWTHMIQEITQRLNHHQKCPQYLAQNSAFLTAPLPEPKAIKVA